MVRNHAEHFIQIKLAHAHRKILQRFFVFIIAVYTDTQRISYTEYLLDILLYGEIEEKAALIAAQGKEVLRLEQRISELAAGNAGSGQKDDVHNGTGADTGRNPGDVRGDAERRREEQHPKLPDGVPA